MTGRRRCSATPSESSSFFNRAGPDLQRLLHRQRGLDLQPRRSEINVQIKRFFDEAPTSAASCASSGRQTDVRISSVVDRANGLLEDINALNVQISRATVTGARRQRFGERSVALIDELSSWSI
jgi:flagellar hook-associated protein 1 FlgK